MRIRKISPVAGAGWEHNPRREMLARQANASKQAADARRRKAIEAKAREAQKREDRERGLGRNVDTEA